GDELEGWLRDMIRYSSGSSDRPFWLEAYGGRSFTVERVGREPLTVDHLSIGVMGGIQPDRLRNLLLRADDDGLLARFQPIWPDAAPLKWPGDWENEKLFDLAIDQLLTLDLVADKDGKRGPMWLAFAEPARGRMYEFQMTVREWEAKADGLLMSYIGKLPG